MEQAMRDEVMRAIARFHRDEQGQEPARIEVNFVGDLLIVRSHDVFTATERELAGTEEGRKLIQSARRDRRSLHRRKVEAEVARVTERSVPRSFYDIDTRNGEQIEVYVLV